MGENIVEKKGLELAEEFYNLEKQLIELQKKEYKLKYPDEIVDFAEVIMVDDMRKTALETYRQFKYPDEYIEKIDKKRATWQTTVGLTIFNKTMGEAPRILISRKLRQSNTFMHENTHINDYYAFCSKHNYLDLNFLEFLELPEFEAIYLLSEYRAFYKDFIYVEEGLVENGKSIDFQDEREILQLHKDLGNAFEQQNLEYFKYIIMHFVGKYSAFTKLYPKKMKDIEILLVTYDERIFNLNKFLYSLRDLSLINLEPYFKEFTSYIRHIVYGSKNAIYRGE